MKNLQMLSIAATFWLISNLAIATTLSSPVQILAVGDSLTEGYRLDPSESYPAVLQRNLREAGWKDVKVVNAGISGATSAGAKEQIAWRLKATKFDAVILALGANDGLRGIAPSATTKNLREAISEIRKSGAQILLAGMKMPPNYGKQFTKEYEKIFPEVAKAEKVELVPFLLENVAGVPELNLPDGIHPNAKGYEIVAKNVEKYIVKLLPDPNTKSTADGNSGAKGEGSK